MRTSLACFAVILLCNSWLHADDNANAHANRSVVTFTGHNFEVTTLAFSGDGDRIGSVSSDSVCLWDRATGKEIKRLESGMQQATAFNHDLSRLAIGHSFHYDVKKSLRGRLRLIDTASGETLWNINPHGSWDEKFPFPPFITEMAISPDGRWLATVGSVARVGGRHGLSGGVIRLWDVATGKQLWE
jgi:WD40 repeat protein